MPRGDRTGPWGQGPMTGRGAGYCAGYGSPGYINPWGGRFGFPLRGAGRGLPPWGGGRGRVWGGGRGFAGAWAYPPPFPPAYGHEEPTPEHELQFLRSQTGMLENEIKAIRKRMEELEAQRTSHG